MAKRDAFSLAQETADKYKNEIKAELQGARITAETLATVFETLKDHDLTDRKMMDDILKNALAKKDYITAFCIAYDPNALDGKDAEFAGEKPAYDETGRFAPYWNKLGGNIDVEPLYDIDIADWYVVPKTTQHEYITNPYPYQVQGHPVMLASLVFPIVHDGQFIGIISSDIVLDKLQEMMERISPWGQGGHASILSNSGVIVAHPDKSFLGKDLDEAVLFDALKTNTYKVEDAIQYVQKYIQENPVADPDDEAAVEKGNMVSAFLGSLEAYKASARQDDLDLTLFVPEIATEIVGNDQGSLRYARDIKIAIKGGETFTLNRPDYYTVYIPIQFSDVTMPWSVAVSIPMAEVLANANAIRSYVISVSMIAICIIAVILYLVAGSVAKPVLVLADTARSIGEGNFNAIVPLTEGNDEIGLLSRAFKVMVEKINELIQKMQDYANELEEKNKYLNKLNVLKDEFLANTSHELRTPINGIIGIVESMVDGAVGPLTREQKYNLVIVSNSGKRLSNMINDILDFTKLKNKEITLQTKPVDLKMIVDTILVLSKTLVKGKDLVLTNTIDKTLPMVDADENRIQQILYNLLGNAIKFTEKGKITVSAKTVDDMIAVSIADTGIGIPAAKFDRIFESFEQVDGSTAREYGGTGLGLSITKKLVELHGGIIRLESKVNEGSTFTFTVPLSTAEKESVSPRGKTRKMLDVDEFDGGSFDKGMDTETEKKSGVHKILVVDDEPVNIQVLKNLLSVHNYSTSVAYSGPAALKLIEDGEEFDLILLDVMMPKMTGYEVCRELREKYSLFELPILMLTAKNQIQDIVLGFQSGANDYLQKPFDKVELLARVKTLLSLKFAVTSAINNEKQFENEKQKRIFGQTMLEVTNAITSTLDLKEVLVKILDVMAQFIEFDKSAVLLNEDGKFIVKDDNGFATDEFFEGAAIDAVHDQFLNKIIQTKETVISNDLRTSLLSEIQDGKVLAGIPINYRDSLLGIIIIYCRDKIISNELLVTLAGQAGVAIQNARLFAKINAMATTDGLTGLNNRRHFFELAEKEFTKFKRNGNPLSVCMIDIDHFKSINDNYGHAIGDLVLQQLAVKLTGLLREYDIVGRYGGEEFAIILPETPLEVAASIAERIRVAIETMAVTTAEFGDIKFTLSIGVSMFTAEAKAAAAVFAVADKGLYEAKETGRNKVVVKIFA
ncbi:MAG: diguanylate cyclase [Planctomycetota bacterium]|nr:diguanylate cyclase [Planctomycetota bacterium]